jgi:hypothetical protein
MIEIADVRPTPREARPLTGGWGAIHWVCVFPTYAFLIGFLAFGVVAVSLARESLPPGLFGGFLLGSWLLWALGQHWQRRSYAAEARRAPAGALAWRWRIDQAGLQFDTGLQSNRVDWRAVKTVRDEKDRFLFLVSPAYNPVLPKRLLDERQLTDLRGLISEVQTSGRLGAGLEGAADLP